MHPTIAHVLRFFEYGHLPPDLEIVALDFYDLAHKTVERAPDNPETPFALRKLLEARDAAWRTLMPTTPTTPF